MRRPGWLTRNLLVLTAVSFSQDAASELIYPLLPLLLTGILGAPAVVVGVVEGIADGLAGATKYVSGRWSDRIGRLPLVRAGYSLAAVGKVIVAAAWAWPVVLVGRSVDRVGKGVRGAPRDALLAGGAPDGSMGKVFGFHRAGDTLGAVVGPLLGLAALTALGGNVRAALWVAVIPAVLSVLLIGFARERHPAAAAPHPAEPPIPVLPHSPLPRSFWRVTLLLGAIAAVNMPDALLLLRLSQTGWSAEQVIGAYVLFNISYAALSYPAGAATDRIGPARVYALGLACFAVGVIGIGVVGASGWALVFLVIYGAFPALTDGVGKAWISGLVDDEVRGRAQGVFQAIISFGVLAAGLWVGLTWSAGSGSGSAALVLAGSLAAVAAVACAAFGKRLATPVPAA